MPSISNLELTIQKTTAQQAPTASRLVTVSYQLGFTQAEINARANFQVRVSLLSNDNDSRAIRTFNLTAVTGMVSRTETTTFQRNQLDEDHDSFFNQHAFPPIFIIVERTDVWMARVTVTYVPEQVFGNASSLSPSVTGSWGAEGDD